MDELEHLKTSLDDVFSPRGVAVVGVSAKKIGFAEIVVEALKSANHPAVFPVNPNYTEVLGLPCYASILDIKEPVDHVVVNIPASASLSLIDDCITKGVKSVHFFTAGFGESGMSGGAELEKQLLDKARSGGLRIIGPNCIGLYVPKSRLHFALRVPLDSGPIGFLSQSGGHAQNLPEFSQLRGLRYSKVISYGNGLDINESELFDYFRVDDETELIAAYIEGVKDGQRFIESLGRAASRKPVIIYKGGKTEAGQRAAKGHTASMTSSIAAFEALCKQKNAIWVKSIEEMIDILVAFRFVKSVPSGFNVGLFGSGGGPSVLAGDEMEEENLCLPEFSDEAKNELKKVLPVPGSIFINPLDTPNLTTPEAIKAALNVLGKQSEIDMLVYHLGFHPIGNWGNGLYSSQQYLDTIISIFNDNIKTYGKPILMALRPPQDLHSIKEFLIVQEAFIKAGFPVFHSMRHLARAMNRMVTWNNFNSPNR